MCKKLKLKMAIAVLVLFVATVAYGSKFPKHEYQMDSFSWAMYVLQREYGLPENEAFRIADVADEAHLDQHIPIDLMLAIMAVESKFDPNAHSPCHAIGLMQVRPDVWDGVNPFNIHDRNGNVFAGAWVLNSYRHDLGDIDSAIKAYNIGITRFRSGAAKGAANRYLIKVNIQRARMKKYPLAPMTVE